MTNSARWLLLIPLVIAAAAVPTVLALRDPLHDARHQLASMTPAQRKEIERNRDAYDQLTTPEQYELRQFNEELANLKDPNERAELEATMGRLQAWVATFPDDIRAKYDKGMTSERIAILKSQLKRLDVEKRTLFARVNQAEAIAKTMAPTPQEKRAKFGDVKRLLERAENRIKAAGTADDHELLKLAKDPMTLRHNEKLVVLSCLSPPVKGGGKLKGSRIEPAADQVPIGMLRSIEFVPAFKRLPNDPSQGLPEAKRAELMKTLRQIYLLTPPENTLDLNEVLRRLNVPFEMRPKPPDPPLFYLLRQLVTLKEYAEGKQPPLKDLARVRSLLGKSP
jgi:hypothetical protein